MLAASCRNKIFRSAVSTFDPLHSEYKKCQTSQQTEHSRHTFVHVNSSFLFWAFLTDLKAVLQAFPVSKIALIA